LASLELKIKSLEQKTAQPNFWSDMQTSQKVLRDIKNAKDKIAKFSSIESSLGDLSILVTLGIETQDLSIIPELTQDVEKLKTDFKGFRLQTLLTGPYDVNNAIIALHAGAGGTEAQDWVEMLLRMYSRWASKKGYSVKTLDILPGDDAGIKSVAINIIGENAYGFLKSEKGVHRLVRISPFDSSGRRHTSFASLDVMPELSNDLEIDISPEELQIDTFRSSGAGGQHVNKTESAIRITHVPTGIVVSCQTQRSQFQNKATAMKMLTAKLLELKEQQLKQKIDNIKGLQMEIGWGSQIRSYVFCPYTLVKDHRTNYEEGNIEAVMDGEIDGFINSYLSQFK